MYAYIVDLLIIINKYQTRRLLKFSRQKLTLKKLTKYQFNFIVPNYVMTSD